MLITDIRRIIEQVSRDKGIEREVLVHALEEAIRSAAKKRFGGKVDLDVRYNEQLGEIEVFQFKEVVEEIEDPELQMSLEEGMKLDPDCEIGDSLGTKMNTAQFGRIAAQCAKQVIIQKMKDAERDAVYGNFISRKGEIVNGVVQRFEKQNIIVNLGQAEALLPARERMPSDQYRQGDRIRAYVLDVRRDTHGAQIILSRARPEFVVALLKTEVPELAEGVVKVVEVVREPGARAKVAVSSMDSDIDPVGACIGINCARVQTVMDELRGERVDIIDYQLDPAKYVCKALSPARIIRVIIDEENRSMDVIVEKDSLKGAIGKGGHNVRLASRLTKWRLEVKSEEDYSDEMRKGYESLLALPGVGIAMADALKEGGFYSAEEIARSTPEELGRVRNCSAEEAEALIQAARGYLRRKREEESRERDRRKTGESPDVEVPAPERDGGDLEETGVETSSDT